MSNKKLKINLYFITKVIKSLDDYTFVLRIANKKVLLLIDNAPLYNKGDLELINTKLLMFFLLTQH